MQIIETVDQGSDEWHELRRGVVTASRFKDVMSKGRGAEPSKTRLSYMMELAAEILTDEINHLEPNKYMIWGTETEPRAKANYEINNDVDVKEVTFIKHGSLNCGVSPDGLIGSDGGLEIKCPKTTTQLETYLSGKMPSQHKSQVQGCLWVSEREWWDFVSYDPRINAEAEYFQVRVYRDEDYIKSLEEGVKEFNEQLNEMINKLKGK
jgi:putative phage-type endonuclease